MRAVDPFFCGLWKVTVFHNGWVSTQRMNLLSSFPCLSQIREQYSDKTAFIGKHMGESVWLHTFLNTVRICGFCKTHTHDHEQACTDTDTSCMAFTHFILPLFHKLDSRLSSQNSKSETDHEFQNKIQCAWFCEVSSNYELGKFRQPDREKLFYFFPFWRPGPMPRPYQSCIESSQHWLALAIPRCKNIQYVSLL